MAGQPWQYFNERKIEVKQRFEVFALKLIEGDLEALSKFPNMMALAEDTEQLARSFEEYYPALGKWTIDEAVWQKNYSGNNVLSMHRDNYRHPGLIFIYNITGRADLASQYMERQELNTLDPGSLVILRAPGLSKTIDGARPEHAVEYASPGRVSLTFRANTRPKDIIDGFYYDNWPVS